VKLAAPSPFQIVLWISAKRRRFEDGQIMSVENPDFVDLESALTRILTDYGWTKEATLDLLSKRQVCLDLLNHLPALLVIDDADTLEGQSEDAAEFFTFYVPQTKSKVLLTSRRVLFGMGKTTTHISGLKDEDGIDFVRSRCRLLELDFRLIEPFVAEMIKTTEGSPLYLEDLLRLCAVLPAAQALRSWKDKAGDEARQYALGRELDMLTKRAKEMLVAACISGKPTSYPELEALTGAAQSEIMGALSELQRLFLLPKPTLHEGEQRYNINVNTRMLVKKVLGGSDLYRRVEAAYVALSGDTLTPTARKEVAGVIRKATILVKSREQAAAETLLRASLDAHPNDPDLLAFLGWVCKACAPPRVTDAEEHFKRAAQLNCKNEAMYKHWARMEIDQGEWAKAAAAAEKGLKLAGETRLLYFLAGYARSRLGKELLGGLHREKGRDELIKARELLQKALKAPQTLETGERQLNADVYRALVLTCESLRDVAGMRDYFECWRREHPDDPDAESEWHRLGPRFGLAAAATN
jgi:hypothetical protein